jgi:hypothetical protein
MRMERQPDVAKLIVTFRNYGNAHKSAILYRLIATQRKMLRGKRLTKSLTH